MTNLLECLLVLLAQRGCLLLQLCDESLSLGHRLIQPPLLTAEMLHLFQLGLRLGGEGERESDFSTPEDRGIMKHISFLIERAQHPLISFDDIPFYKTGAGCSGDLITTAIDPWSSNNYQEIT